MNIGILIFIVLLRIALPQSAGHASYGSAEYKDGVLTGNVTFNTSEWINAVAHWYKSDITKSPKNNIEVYERNYFKNFFRLWADQTQIPLASLDRKEDSTSITYSFSFAVGDANELMIDHRAIFDLYPDHTHTMTFRMYGKDRTYIFKQSHPTFFAKSKPEVPAETPK